MAGRQLLQKRSTHTAINAFIGPVADLQPATPTLQTSRQDALPAKDPPPRLKLSGRLIGIKDNICTVDTPTTCASSLLHNYRSPYAATVVSKLLAAGAQIAGKTNLDEFGMGSHSTHSASGLVSNAVNASLSAGGSSGGSAAAAASGQCWAALGTDTGGSIRLPAAYNGICGFKPSYGLVSRFGVVAYANSLDTVGILARRVQDVRAVFDQIQGYDAKDPTSLSPQTRERIARTERFVSRDRALRIGVPTEYNLTELDPLIRRSWSQALRGLQKIGHTVQRVSLPQTKAALAAYYVLAPAEASSNMAKYDGVRYGQHEMTDGGHDMRRAATRGNRLGPEVQRRILLGTYSLSASAMDNYFIQAQRVRRLVRDDLDRVFALEQPLLDSKDPREKRIDEPVLDHMLASSADTSGSTFKLQSSTVDVLITPTATSFPPRLQDVQSRTPIETYRDDVLTVPASLAGLPALNVPVPVVLEKDKTAPVPFTGLQVIGQYGDDETVLQVSRLLEDVCQIS